MQAKTELCRFPVDSHTEQSKRARGAPRESERDGRMVPVFSESESVSACHQRPTGALWAIQGPHPVTGRSVTTCFPSGRAIVGCVGSWRTVLQGLNRWNPGLSSVFLLMVAPSDEVPTDFGIVCLCCRHAGGRRSHDQCPGASGCLLDAGTESCQ
jgi:hypothetical protein